MSKREAFTLMEMVIAMSVGAIMLSIAVSWLHYSMAFSSKMKSRQNHHQSTTRLARDFRSHVQIAKEAKVIDPNQLQLSFLNGETATFSFKNGRVSFLVKQQQNDVRQEMYWLDPNTSVRWNGNEPSLVSMQIFRDTLKGKDPRVELEVLAKANRWSRVVAFQESTDEP